MYTTKKDKGNPLPADCRKTFVFSENGGVAYCLLCWFCIVQNFWQAIKASLLWGVAPVQVVSHLCHRIVQWLCAAGEVWTAKNVPIPFLRDSTQYVSDPDGYVDKAQKDSAKLVQAYFTSALSL